MLFYYPITAPANTNVIIISVLLIIAGGLMIGVGICQIVATWKLYQNETLSILCGEFVSDLFMPSEYCCITHE